VGFHVQQMGPELLGWAVVIAGLAALALLLRLREQRQTARAQRQAASAEPRDMDTPATAAAREWRLVTDAAMRELARAGELAPMQARAVSQIDAAEHAFNRLAVELAKLGCQVVTPTVEPVRQLTRAPAAAPQRQPLAA
jgi:hypothetical protein